ncbi:TolC family protein [Chitinophaga lutea]
MKRVLILLVSISCAFQALAQKADTSIILQLPADAPTVARLKLKLVELALANPALSVLDIKKEIARYETNRAKAEWLNLFSAQGNLNEFTLKGGSNNNFFPRYNFGVNVPFGAFVSIPSQVKIAKANGKLAEAQRESDALELKGLVLKAYEDYSADKQLYELQIPLLEDARTTYNQTEEQFKANTENVSVDVLNTAYRQFNNEMVRKVELERKVRQSKLTLEAIIGQTLEEVLRNL